MNHEAIMRRAIQLASRGRTSPNPMVGAVIVKDDAVVGEGYHKAAGQPHAEIIALRSAGVSADGATIYVTLEPCSHFGRTPPCADALIRAGIKDVYVGMLDPDVRVSGNGIKKLQNAGITVHTTSLLENECRALNEAYIKHRTKSLPLVTIKAAMSLDGRIATRQGDSKWITGIKARAYAHKFRSKVDAIIVGAQTARSDNPSLTARIGKRTYYPLRVIVSSSGHLPSDLQMLELPGRTMVVVGQSCKSPSLMQLEKNGAEILRVEEVAGRLSLLDMMKNLAQQNILSVLVEGGGELLAGCLEQHLVDKAMFYYAPKIIGGRDAVPAIGGQGVSLVGDSPILSEIKRHVLGDDLLVEGRIVYTQ